MGISPYQGERQIEKVHAICDQVREGKCGGNEGLMMAQIPFLFIIIVIVIIVCCIYDGPCA